MMGWMSRLFDGVMVGIWLECGSEVGKNEVIFGHVPATIPTQNSSHGPEDPRTTIDYHCLDLSRHDGMDEQAMFDSVMVGIWLECGSEVGKNQVIFGQHPNAERVQGLR